MCRRRVEPEELCREGCLRVEHWRKEGAAEEKGIWVFVALKPGWRVPEEDIEASVWWKVEDLEGLREDDEVYEWG